jgi:hypothetical protein
LLYLEKPRKLIKVWKWGHYFLTCIFDNTNNELVNVRNENTTHQAVACSSKDDIFWCREGRNYFWQEKWKFAKVEVNQYYLKKIKNYVNTEQEFENEQNFVKYNTKYL